LVGELEPRDTDGYRDYWVDGLATLVFDDHLGGGVGEEIINQDGSGG